MKTKKFNKSLSLNKETVASLNNQENNQIKAGATNLANCFHIERPTSKLLTIKPSQCICSGYEYQWHWA